MARDNTQEKGGLFADLSIAQVVAAALAAVTSMLLASKIGIAGSVIGVAVASVVATVSSQIYKNFISVSADKIHNLASNSNEDTDAKHEDAGNASSRTTAHATTVYPAVNDAFSTQTARRAYARSASTTAAYRPSDASTYSREHVRERVAANHHSKTPLKVIIVTIVSAIVAVLLVAAIINIVTSSQGIGTKTAPILTSSVEDTTATTDTTSTTNTNGSQTSTSTTDGSKNSQGTGSNQSGTTQNSQNDQGTSSTNGTSNTNGSSSTDTGTSGSSQDYSGSSSGQTDSSSETSSGSSSGTTDGSSSTDSSSTTGGSSSTG